jgi:hypothetical protein
MTRMDFQNQRDVKHAAATKLRSLGHKIPSRCKFDYVVALVEREMGRSAGGRELRLLLDFLRDARPGPLESAHFNALERPLLKFDRHMQLAAERAKCQPVLKSMGSDVQEYRFIRAE